MNEEKQQENQSNQAGIQQIAKKQDTHSYKGWLNSDSFLKRALAVYGYSAIGGLIISIPIIILIGIAGAIFAAVFFGAVMSGVDREIVRTPQPKMGKIDMNIACDQALAYTDFSNASDTKQFIEDCTQGRYPEVIDQYLENLEQKRDTAI